MNLKERKKKKKKKSKEPKDKKESTTLPNKRVNRKIN